MEAIDNAGPEGLLCHRCHHVLTFAADRNAGGHEQSTRLNDQFRFISELLPKLDEVHIPECDFDRALAKARPVVRDATHQVAATIPMDSELNRPMAVKGLTNTGPQSISVNISTAEGASEAEKEAEAARREKLAAQNALPSWMSNSTVTGEAFAGSTGAGPAAVKNEVGSDEDSKQKNVDSKAIAQIDDIFESLKAEQAAKKLQGESENEDDSDEDEDDFEDVPATSNNSGLGTPALSQSMKREASGDLSRDESNSEHSSKRAKIEPEGKREEADDSVEDDEDEMEFEDV